MPSNETLEKIIWGLGVPAPSAVTSWVLSSELHQPPAILDAVHFAELEGQHKRLSVPNY